MSSRDTGRRYGELGRACPKYELVKYLVNRENKRSPIPLTIGFGPQPSIVSNSHTNLPFHHVDEQWEGDGIMHLSTSINLNW